MPSLGYSMEPPKCNPNFSVLYCLENLINPMCRKCCQLFTEDFFLNVTLEQRYEIKGYQKFN